MAVGSRQSTGPLQISDIDVYLINDVLRQIQDKIDILSGLTGLNLNITAADAATLTVNFIPKLLTSTSLANSNFTSGSAGQFGIGGAVYGTANNIFKSGGPLAAPSWGTVSILDSASHGDTLTGTVVRGDVIYGNSTPKWARLAVGTTGQYLGTDGTDVSWISLSTIDHGALTGLADDDHTQYLLASAATSRVLFASNWLDLTDGGATTLHSHAGGLTGSGTDNQVAIWNGTTAIDAFNATAGSVLFAGVGGILAQDNTNFFWDDTNNRLGLGTATPNQQLELTGNLRLVASTSTAGIIYSGANTLLHTFGTNNTFIGVSAGNLTLSGANYNVGIGDGSLGALTTGYFNTAIGRLSGSALTTGTDNVFIGLNCAIVLAGGSENVIIGSRGLNTSSTASNTVGIGYSTLASATTIIETTAVGNLALNSLTTGDYNTALGSSALQTVTTGEWNTGCGRASLIVTTGDKNAALGFNAGFTNTTGSSNTYVGSQADTSAIGLTYSTVIGSEAIVAQSAYVMLGRSSECVGIAGAARPTGSGGLIFPDGTALSSMASNTAGLYANDVGGTVTMFNIAEDGRIKDLLWPRVARCGTQFDSITVTLGDVTGLTHTLAAAGTYEFEAILHVDASVVGGSKFAITGDGVLTATSITYHIDLLDNTTNAHTITSRQTALAGAAGQAGTTAGICKIVGTIVVNVAGALRVQFAQNVANGTSSVLVNSSFTVRKLD